MDDAMTCAILTGGRSRRMGRDKATVLVGGAALVKRTYDVARQVFGRIIIVSSLHERIEGVDAPIVRDVLPVSGSLTGIVSALIGAGTPYVFVLGCDLPFITADALRYLAGILNGEDIVIPRTGAGLEPMHAIYGRACISPMLSAIEAGRMKVIDGRLLSLLSVRIVPPGPVFSSGGVSVFTNVNTEEDLKVAERLLP